MLSQSQLGFVDRNSWGRDYGLGEVDVNGDCQVHEAGVVYEVPADLHGGEMNDEDEVDANYNDCDDDNDGLTDTDEPMPINDPDPADAFPRVLKPALLENTSGLLPRKLLRGASRLRHGHRSWKAANPLYRRHRRLARRTSASLMEAAI